ncbi:hypothetical protein GOODEAATRI_013896 [Goodea atripinnis]|uniref:Uncharacterized protein n=1 Tax=Goodea atripinnis TaxID=208336 RepID=A0ABV0PE55_9TELE
MVRSLRHLACKRFPGNEMSDPEIARTLTLISKTIQTLGSWGSLSKKLMFQVVLSEKPLYVQAGNCVEASEWLEILGQVSRCNEGRLTTYHPSNYTAGAWHTMLANLQLDIDCDREAERIFSLLSSNESKLQNMEGQHIFMSC